MELLLNISSSLLDAFILSVFLFSAFGRIKQNKVIWYLLSLVVIEVILYVDQLWMAGNPESRLIWLAVTCISFLTTLWASMFFKARILARLLASLLFQLLYVASESIFTFLILKFQPDLTLVEDQNMLFATMSFGSVVTMLFLILILRLILKRNREGYPLQYHIQLLTVPLITFLILSLLRMHSFYETEHIDSYILLIILLAIMNVVNYVQIEWSARFLHDRQQIKEMQLQFNYQRQKYDQLSESYRSGRRFLHDTKKHYFVMQKYLQEKQYDKLEEYIKKSFGDLENHYAKYNTGNLVIDSFMTSFDHMSEQKGIQFEAILHADVNRIPVEDYDLCVILGNLLDNALAACEKAPSKDRFIRILLETTKKDLFVIEEENTMNSNITSTRSETDLEHGYGLLNIRQTVDKYHGMMGYTTGETFNMFIRIPITEPEQRTLASTPTKSESPCKIRFSGVK